MKDDSEEGWEPIAGGDAEQHADSQLGEDVQDILNAVEDLLQAAGDSSGASSAGPPQEDLGAADVSDFFERPNKEKSKKSRPSIRQLRNRLKTAKQNLQISFNLKRTLVKPVARKTVHATRKLVTGSPSTRVRDYVVLPSVVRVLDKYTFTGGVMGMLTTEYVLLVHPDWFRYYYVAVLLPMFLLRWVNYRRTKQQYFLLDYCYWINGVACALSYYSCLSNSTTTTTTADTHDWEETLWQMMFVSANGPLIFAMIAWNNSLVFHSVDKVTSTYIHIFPPLLSLCERWLSKRVMNDDPALGMSWSRHLGYPIAFYLVWQIVYLFQTEVWYRHKLDADEELSTSLRYLASAEKMAINKQTLKLCRQMGIMGPNETFHPPTLKVKMIFVGFQLIMTIMTFLPIRLLYAHEYLHCAVVMATLTYSVYNGARYYIQVFSKIYEKRYSQGHGQEEEEEYVDTSVHHSQHAKKE